MFQYGIILNDIAKFVIRDDYLPVLQFISQYGFCIRNMPHLCNCYHNNLTMIILYVAWILALVVIINIL